MKRLAENPDEKKRVLMIRLDQPSVTMLRGKFRWHVVMKMLVHPCTDSFVAFITERVREVGENSGLFFEYNPVSMM